MDIRHQLRLLCLAVLLIVSGCGKQEKQKLIVGTEATFPPYEYYSGEKITGIDVDIVCAAAARMNREAVLVDMSFDSILEALSSGRIDVAASAISITEERKKLVDFSDPYEQDDLSIIVPLNSTIRQLSDLKGKLVGVQRGTTSDDYVTKNFQTPSRFPNSGIAAQNLAEGKIDALVVDSCPGRLMLRRWKNLKQLPLSLKPEYYAFAVRKGNKSLLKTLNETIRELKENGKMPAILDKHEMALASLMLQKKNKTGILRVAVDPTFPPIGYLVNGKPDGIEIELLYRIAEKLDRTAVFEQVGFDSLFEAVANDNNVEIGAGSISVTPERAKIVSFSVPYFSSCQYLYVRKDSPAKKLGDLQGKKIGAIYCTTAESYLKSHRINPQCFSEGRLLFKALSEGQIDGAMMDEDPAEVFMQEFRNLKRLPDVLLKEEYAFAVRKENQELLKQINGILLHFRADGTMHNIREKHFKLFRDKKSGR